MQTTQILQFALDPRIHRLAERVAWILKGRLSVPIVLAVVGVALAGWLLFGLRLRGTSLALWLLVPPIVVAACVCVAGPGRLFAKNGHEGRVVFQIARKDAVTLLDVVGLGLAAVGLLLALSLVSWRVHALRRSHV